MFNFRKRKIEIPQNSNKPVKYKISNTSEIEAIQYKWPISEEVLAFLGEAFMEESRIRHNNGLRGGISYLSKLDAHKEDFRFCYDKGYICKDEYGHFSSMTEQEFFDRWVGE